MQMILQRLVAVAPGHMSRGSAVVEVDVDDPVPKRLEIVLQRFAFPADRDSIYTAHKMGGIDFPHHANGGRKIVYQIGFVGQKNLKGEGNPALFCLTGHLLQRVHRITPGLFYGLVQQPPAWTAEHFFHTEFGGQADPTVKISDAFFAKFPLRRGDIVRIDTLLRRDADD